MDAQRESAGKLRVAFELHEAGVQMMRLTLQRRHRGASPQRIEELVGEWLRTRPGAEHGDGQGRHRVEDDA